MREGVYELVVFHARTKPVAQSFRIHGYSLFIDAARFDNGAPRLGWGHRFQRSDFSLLKRPGGAVASALEYLQREAGIAADKVFLLAHPRIMGYVFNPVSFFFFFEAEKHVATVVEVNNTFGEQKHFILPAGSRSAQARKNFYVSPFLSPFLDFHMSIAPPDDKLSIGIHTRSENGTELVAEMSGGYFPFGRFTLLRFFFKYPFHTLRVITLIHWYALKLLARRVPFFPKATADAAVLHADLRSQR